MEFSLVFEGNEADRSEIEFYDAAKAVMGFQRSLALTTHLVVNGEIITQAPSLRGAQILVKPPEEGSWKIVATLAVGAFTLTTASKETPVGHLIYSAYDYVISNTLGFHVDYDKSLGEQHEEYLQSRGINEHKAISEEKLDSLMEKTETALIDVHRPLVWSGTAARAGIFSSDNQLIGKIFTPASYEYASKTVKMKMPEQFSGLISSYNVNTFRGRIFLFDEVRPVPFELAEDLRNIAFVEAIVNSLQQNAVDRMTNSGSITVTAFRNESSTGRLKSLYITDIEK